MRTSPRDAERLATLPEGGRKGWQHCRSAWRDESLLLRLSHFSPSLTYGRPCSYSFSVLSVCLNFPPSLTYSFSFSATAPFPPFAGSFLCVLSVCPISPFCWLIPFRSLRLLHFSSSRPSVHILFYSPSH